MNINGTYTSENGDFVLQITNSDSTHSTFEGTYTASYTAQGQQTFNHVVGRWWYVGGGGAAPLSVGFVTHDRASGGWPYCIADAWSGILTETGKLSMTGTRSYLTSDGSTQELSSLGTHQFST